MGRDLAMQLCIPLLLGAALAACGGEPGGANPAAPGAGGTAKPGDPGTAGTGAAATDDDSSGPRSPTTAGEGGLGDEPETTAVSTGEAPGVGGPDYDGDGGDDGPVGCEPALDMPDSLFPLSPGREWTYEVSFNGRPTREVRTVTGTREVDRREAFVVEADYGAGPMEQYWVRTDGEYERWSEVGFWERRITEPVEADASWEQPWPERPGQATIVEEYRWTPVPEVTVPAGVFTDCWRAAVCRTFDGECTGIGSSVTYCPGIGPVEDFAFETQYRLVHCQP